MAGAEDEQTAAIVQRAEAVLEGEVLVGVRRYLTFDEMFLKQAAVTP
ncbi:MAG: hypothetical protein R3C10_25430 [Pirellulales bacterium]